MNRPATPAIPEDVEQCAAPQILAMALARLGSERLALAASFSTESIVLLDLLRELNARPRVFVIDTGRLPRETCDLIDRAGSHFGVDVEIYAPDATSVQRMVEERGVNLFYRSADDRRLCCRVRRIEPLERALVGASGWITGLRRDESAARSNTPKIAHDPDHGGIWKIAPLADWSAADVWRYVKEHALPHNRLYDVGYQSIGCDPCTRAVAAGDDPRSGRWWWEDGGDRECGMHVPGKPIASP